MNTFVADPHWGWWIVWYFYLGGIAAGAYFLASLSRLFGTENDQRVARAGYLIAAPLVAICGLLLIIDLSFPARFWHMLLDPETWRPHIKILSPMSIGAWALLVFGLVSMISFLAALAESGVRVGRFRWLSSRLHRGIPGRAFDLIGTACGFFIASYTGALLTATNQPVWSDSPWIGALFLASSAGTGLAAIKLFLLPFGPRLPEASKNNGSSSASADIAGPAHTNAKLERLEPLLWWLELATVGLFIGSLNWSALSTIAATGVAWIFLGGALGLGILVPGILRWSRRLLGRSTPVFAALAVLIGGFLLRYSILAAPSTMVHTATVRTANELTADEWSSKIRAEK